MSGNSCILNVLSYHSSSVKRVLGNYVDESGNVFQGTWTNDAPCCYLLQKAHDNPEVNDVNKVLCIVSNAVDSYESSITEFEDYLTDFAKEKGMNHNVEIERIRYDEDEDDRILTSQKIYKRIEEIIRENNIENVYVDFTGGFRDTNLYIVSIIKYLKLIHVNCESVVYSQQAERGSEFAGKLYEIDYISDFFDIISGVDEFNTTGYTTTLQKVLNKVQDDQFQKILESIMDFTNDLSLDKITDIESKVKAIRDALNAYENVPDNSIYTVVFKSMLPIIRKEMKIDEMFLAEGEINYPTLISWCLDHDLVQQAMTLYVEKIPGYYLRNDKKLCEAVKERFEIMKSSHDSWDLKNNQICRTNYFELYLTDNTVIGTKEFKKEFIVLHNQVIESREFETSLYKFSKLIQSNAKKTKYPAQMKKLSNLITRVCLEYEMVEKKVGPKDKKKTQLSNVFDFSTFFACNESEDKQCKCVYKIIFNNFSSFEKITNETKTALCKDFHKYIISLGIVEEYKKLILEYFSDFEKFINQRQCYTDAFYRTVSLMKDIYLMENENGPQEQMIYGDFKLKTDKLTNLVALLSADNAPKADHDNWQLYHYLLRNDKEEFEYLSISLNVEKNEKQNYTIIKKMELLKRMKDQVDEKTYQRNLYYILVNYYRNCVAHGKVNRLKEKYNEEASKFLMKEGIFISFTDFDFEQMNNFMRNAINVSKLTSESSVEE